MDPAQQFHILNDQLFRESDMVHGLEQIIEQNNNSPISHALLVKALVKPGDAILESLTPEKCNLWHMASCIPGEAGELFDAVKKHVLYNKDLDRENVIEELGDLEFYMEGLRQQLGITRDETLKANIDKLSVRYGQKYSDQAAQERKDKHLESQN